MRGGNPLVELYSRYQHGRQEGRFAGELPESGPIVQSIREEIELSREALAELLDVSGHWLYLMEVQNIRPSKKLTKALLDIYVARAPGEVSDRVARANRYVDALYESALLTHIKRIADRTNKAFRDLYYRL